MFQKLVKYDNKTVVVLDKALLDLLEIAAFGNLFAHKR